MMKMKSEQAKMEKIFLKRGKIRGKVLSALQFSFLMRHATLITRLAHIVQWLSAKDVCYNEG